MYDWYELLRDILKNEYGFDNTVINLLSENGLPFKTIYPEERRIISKPRVLHESLLFHCLPEMVNGWDT